MIYEIIDLLTWFKLITTNTANYSFDGVISSENCFVFNSVELFNDEEIVGGQEILSISNNSEYDTQSFRMSHKTWDGTQTKVYVKGVLTTDSAGGDVAITYRSIDTNVKNTLNMYRDTAMVALETAFCKEDKILQESAYSVIERKIIVYYAAGLFIMSRALTNMEGDANDSTKLSGAESTSYLKKAKSGNDEVEFGQSIPNTSGTDGHFVQLTVSYKHATTNYFRVANSMLLTHYGIVIDDMTDGYNQRLLDIHREDDMRTYISAPRFDELQTHLRNYYY